MAACSDVITFDWENIPGGALAPLEKLTQVRPPRAALEVSQDRLAEKALFSRLRIPVAAHAAIDSKEQLVRAAETLGLPGILKTRRLGYDGKGQFLLSSSSQIEAASAAIGGPGLIYEKFQDVSREISIVGARSKGARQRQDRCTMLRRQCIPARHVGGHQRALRGRHARPLRHIDP